ncbi:MAG: multicopper oxidase domain-containing protein [Verrucomicrobiota bacterium]
MNRWLRLLLLSLAALAFVLGGAKAQEVEGGAIRPTVTVETGDTGGTFFGHAPDPQKTRHYYVAAESELWDFAPSGREELCGGPLPPQVARQRKSGKLRYVQYTDATFTTRVLPTRSLGILGPMLRGVVGEFLAVTFFNRTDQTLSMHPHGVKYDKHSEGAYHIPFNGRGSAVGAGAKFTYVWHLDEQSGPMPQEPSSRAWLYHSHVTGDGEANLGLIGAIIVTDPKRARPDGTPNDVDREFATLFMIFDESGLDDAAIEAAEYAGLPGLASETTLTWTDLQQQLEAGSRSSINGLVFGNLSGLAMNEGERTRWYLFALGSERDFHTAHWHGLRVVEEGRRRTDSVELLPATMKVADVVADNPGSWLFHCHVADHMKEGMFTALTVYPRDSVGVGRAPEDAFLGYGPAQSLRLDRAEARLNLATKPARAEVIVEGSVTVFDGFAAYNEPIRVRVGGRTIELKAHQNGVADDAEARFLAKNANEAGVVRGGVLEFELVLRGADWMKEIEGGAGVGAGGQAMLKLELEVARGKHVASRAVVRRVQGQ